MIQIKNTENLTGETISAITLPGNIFRNARSKYAC